MANTFLGVGVNFGTAGTTAITGTGIGTFILQSQKHSKSREKEIVKDGDGTDVQATLFNPTQKAVFEYVVSAADAAGAITATKIPDVGALVTVVNASKYTDIADTHWFVWEDPEITFTNTTAARVTLSLQRWTGTNGITAVST